MMIRKFTPTDLDTVMQIWLAGNLDAHPFISRSYWEGQSAAVRDAISQADVDCYVDDHEKVVGFIGLTGDYIAGLFVSRSFRGHKIGYQLLNQVKTTHHHLELDAYQKNTRAVHFYQQNGFVITHQTSDEVRMAWPAKK
ncbi:GNAT family N-acetyltransferase [Limosilactobacillus sp.]|uniref:GNAT family N-acetyltransferase n=1 Tax=Limosilactobacillus sp. TaxID=2773925 RepID=UPI003F05B3F0